MSNHFIKSKIKKWFGNRMPVADTVKLKQRSTYILPTKAGFFMLVIVLLMMIAATNYQNNLAFLLTFLIASIGLVSILFTFNNLQGLEFKIGLVESVFASETLQVRIHIASQSKREHFTIGTGFGKKFIYFTDVLVDRDNHIILPIDSIKRGWFNIPRIMATSSFPFGLLRVWTWFQFATPVLIYPKPVEPPVKGIFGGQDDDDGANKLTGSEDLYGLKIYQSGDPISRIDWKAHARERGLFSKEFVAYQSQDLVFDWNDFPQTDKEIRLSYLCFLVMEASKCNYDYSLQLPQKQISKDHGELHKARCLESLALFEIEIETKNKTKNETKNKSMWKVDNDVT